jgi:thiamine biosynthesis lipoprotein
MSNGTFDVTQSTGRTAANAGRGSWRNIELLSGFQVRRNRNVRIDLGGMAKGFAVDQAVSAMRASGATGGIVNAGGDLRVFGPMPERVSVRHPAAPGTFVPLAQITESAMATSANYFDAPGKGRLRRSDGQEMWLKGGSVTVTAPTCIVADALTKVVAAVGILQSLKLLHKIRARAYVLSETGRLIGAPGKVAHAA